MGVQISLRHFKDSIGYDLKIFNQQATIQDYLTALNHFQEENVISCRGCDNCCYERIPLTSIDVLYYLNNPEIKEHLHHLDQQLPLLTSFVHEYCQVTGQGPVVDITLRRNPNEACVFLNQQEKICHQHPYRSLVCQSYICLPYTKRAGILRDHLLNIGEDDLVHRYLLEAQEKGAAPVIHKNRQATPSLKDYPPNIFTGKSNYQQITIKEVVPPALWKEIFLPITHQ